MLKISREKQQFFSAYWKATDALLSGGAFTSWDTRLECFADVAGPSPEATDFEEAGRYLGWFMTVACGLPHIRSCRVFPRGPSDLGIEVVRVVNGRPVVETRRIPFRNRRMLPPPDGSVLA